MRIVRSFAFLICLPLAALAQSPDRAALEALYHATNGPNWINSEGWLTTEPLDEWYGVLAIDGRVVELDLAGNGLAGQLPNEIAQMTSLYSLDLRWNELHGSIPDVFSNLIRLGKLYLTSNAFTGEIPPALGYLPRLKEMDLSYNLFAGPVPAELWESRSLEGLGLHSNDLSGSVPPMLGLGRLTIGDTSIVGNVQDESLVMAATTLYPARSQSARSITGADVFAESITTFEDDFMEGMINTAMAALTVVEGLLVLDVESVPPLLQPEEMAQKVEQINHKLIENGERIKTVDDLNRAMKLYGGKPIEIENSQGLPSLNAPIGATSPLYIPLTSSTDDATVEDGEPGYTFQRRGPTMYCAIRTHYPHKSTGTIKAKADGACQYVGRWQEIESRLHYLLQKWIDWGIHGYYWTADTNSPNLRRGSNPRWADNSIWVLAPYCTTGTWRSRSNLYVTGSSYGRFRPYPFVTVSLPVYLEC